MNLRTLLVAAWTTVALTGSTLGLEASSAAAAPATQSRSAGAQIAEPALTFSASVQASALATLYQFDGRVRGAIDGTMIEDHGLD